MLKRSDYRGISVGNAMEVFLLLYANDIVLVADTVLELQRKISVLEKFCDKWGMEVNLTKTQDIVFHKVAKLQNLKHFLLGQESKGSRMLLLFGADFFFKK